MKAFITGVGSGIGKETCMEFLANGWDVVGVIRNSNYESGLLDLAANLPGTLTLVKIDLSEQNFQVKLDKLLSNLKGLEINSLINVAGVLSPMLISEYEEDNIQEILSVNFISPVLIIKSVLPFMMGSEFHNIINITSMSGFQGSVRFPGLGIYGASKAALSSITESLSVELQEYNIPINALALGSVNTEMLKEAFPEYTAKTQASEMAAYIFSFASHGFKFYNGKTLPVAISNP